MFAKRRMMLMAATALAPATAHAQPAGNDEPTDIIVTAQRYEQRLHDVPMSVTAIDGEQIRSRNATTINDVQFSVPGLSTFSYGVGESFTQLRGVSNSNGASTIGIYFDDTPVSLDQQGSDLAPRLIDMERIEVLRGPQATLYGQSSMGGTIRYLPAAPRLDRFSGMVDGQVSTTRDGETGYMVTGMANLPLVTDKLAVRVAGAYERNAGWIDNLRTGQRDVNGVDNYVFRGMLRAQPVDRLDIQMLGMYQESNQGFQNFGNNRKTATNIDTPVAERFSLFQGKIAYDTDFATVSASASHINRRLTNNYDFSAIYVPLLALFGFPPGYITSVGLGGDQRFHIFNSELRLASRSDGAFGWALGATYRDLEAGGSAFTYTAPNPQPFPILLSEGTNRNKSFAIYGEARYAITQQLKATVGLRYYRERKRQDLTNIQLGLPAEDLGRATFETLNPRINLSYDVSPDSMVYANVAKGFRSGGFNNTSIGAGLVNIPPSYEPDVIWTYEVGTKHQLLGNRLVFDASLYRSVWSNVQSTTFVEGSALTVVANTGNVSGWGVELSALARPIDALTLSGTLGWNNLKYTNRTVDKAPGDPVDNAIPFTYSLSADYRPALSESLNGVLRVDYQHSGRAKNVSRAGGAIAVLRRPSRDLVSMRIGVAFGETEIALFADNLFDDRTPILPRTIGPFAEDLEQRPRIIGLSASTRF